MKKTSKKSILLTLAITLLTLSLSACGTADDAVTMEKMMEKGVHSTIIDTYGSYKMTTTIAETGDGYVEYHNKNTSYVEFLKEGACQLYIDSELKYEMADGDMYAYLFVDTETYTLPGGDNYLYDPESIKETIKETKTEGDKQIVETEMPKEIVDKILEAEGTENTEYVSGKAIYELQKDDLSLLSLKSYMVNKDGDETLYGTLDVEYGIDSMPDNAKKMYEAATQTENLRKVTIVTNPGTEEEKSWETDVPKGIKVSIYTGDGYKGMYLDKECTQEAPTATNFDEDVTYYMKKN